MEHWEPVRGSWLEKMAYLDSALTGKPWRDVCHTAQRWKDVSLIDYIFNTGGLLEAYYLSDGGYSRIVWYDHFDHNEPGYLVLTTNSTPEVKEAWGRCSELIADIELMADKEINKAYQTDQS